MVWRLPSKTPPKTGIEPFFQKFMWIFTSNGFKMISIQFLQMKWVLKSISEFRAFRKTNFHWSTTYQEHSTHENKRLLTKKSRVFDVSKNVDFLVNKCWFSRIKSCWHIKVHLKVVSRKALNAEILFRIQNMCKRRIEISQWSFFKNLSCNLCEMGQMQSTSEWTKGDTLFSWKWFSNVLWGLDGNTRFSWEWYLCHVWYALLKKSLEITSSFRCGERYA